MVEIREEAEIPSTEEVSLKTIILSHIKKISQICCQELTGSWTEKKPVKVEGGVFFTEIYHPDLREAYCNAVNFLIDVTYPLSDSIFKKYIDEEESKSDMGDVKEKLKAKRKIFKQINIMFERYDFFRSSGEGDE